jgi:hypothetical protein
MVKGSGVQPNNEMQRTSHGQDGGSPLISVFAGPEMDRARVRAGVLTAILAVCPGVLWAAVMDKEPTVVDLWTRALLLGLVGFFAWRRHLALGLIATLIAAAVVWGFHWELTDPYVGPAILREAGQGYVVQAYMAMLACAVLHLGGIAALMRRRRPPEAVGTA